MTWILQHSEATLGARLVALAVANYADKHGRNSYASLRTLAEDAHLSERQVRRCLRELETMGEIVQVSTSITGTHVYELAGMATLFPGQDVLPDNMTPDNMSSPRIVPEGEDNLTPGGDVGVPRTVVLTSKTKNKNVPKPSPEADQLCEILADLITENGSKRPRITDTWRTEARRLIVLDRRPLDEAERILRWSQADEFWRGNILSMPTFRAKYDRLRLASTRQTGRRSSVLDEWRKEHALDG